MSRRAISIYLVVSLLLACIVAIIAWGISALAGVSPHHQLIFALNAPIVCLLAVWAIAILTSKEKNDYHRR